MKSLIYLSHLAIAVLLLSCASCRLNYNNPPKEDLPWPQPHNGVFVSGADTLFFNGDGKSVSWHFSEGMDSLSLQGNGSYVFIFDGAAWRYDAAERLDIYSADHQFSFGLGVPGSCTETMITLRRFDLPGMESKEQTFRLLTGNQEY